ncbi:flavodoxin [Marinobacterium zhoushanense]|uniref:Flavodoxin n=1 Tax=Marinobacterium zhoushanense TaxID=1679163 RepID=A0ABQ1K903_9GAMM|nr:flavodoxin domain-containing protein [Marinobacterium zhoushanense]GGB91970.1 flavodoxin [Marinobacterium zhoushanense]
MAKVQILVGTTNGKALQIAKVLGALLERLGHVARLNETPQAADLVQDLEEVLLICCSTTGDGELPRSLYPLYLALEDRSIDMRDRAFAVVALGDSRYRQFAQAGYMMENAFYLSGAKRIGEIFTLDAAHVANQPMAAAQWAQAWAQHLPEAS